MRNRYSGACYQCGLNVKPGTGHFERFQGKWRVKHANVSGYGRTTCADANHAARAALAEKEK